MITFHDGFAYFAEQWACETGYYSLEGASALDASVFDTGNASITFVSSINDQPYDKDSLYVISNIKYDTLPALFGCPGPPYGAEVR